MKTHFHLAILLLLISAACEKESSQPPFPPTSYPLPAASPIPRISLESYAPEIIKANQDSLFFCFLYWDGDGDTATPIAGESFIRIADNRAPEQIFHDYLLAQPLPGNTNPPLFGGLEAVLPHAVLLDPNNEMERTTFTLQLRDKAGNWSNLVRSGTITIKRGG